MAALLIAAAAFMYDRFYCQIKIKVSGKAKPEPSANIETIKKFGFEEPGSLDEWEEKVFRSRVKYGVEKDADGSFVAARSVNGASAMYYRIKAETRCKAPAIAWRWRVEKFPEKKFDENLEKEEEDDFAARVYVIFPALFLTNSKVIEYIWAERLPVGTVGTSPYSDNIKLMVLRSGIDEDNKWRYEERDILEDYRKMFGRYPEHNIGAVAFMTNTEHTASSAEAMYDDFNIGYYKNGVKGGDAR